MRRTLLCFAVLWQATTASSVLAVGGFDLDVSTFGFSKQQRNAFAEAEAFWENVILDYAPGISQTSVSFTARKLGIDGPGGVLGQAGPSGTVSQGGFVLSTGGSMIIDATDIDLLEADGQLSEVIAHEIGHILGIGTLWTSNGLYVEGSGRYTGTFGLNAYKQEFNPNATFVPVELDGGPGTANAHWDELTSVTDSEGRPLSEELMTGFLGSENYLSQTTLQSLKDLGFIVVEPSIPVVAGDYNNDGTVNLADYTVWRHTLGQTGLDPFSGADGDGDGDVTATDYTVWKSNFGLTSSAALQVHEAVAVPEPASMTLAFVACSYVGFRRRRE